MTTNKQTEIALAAVKLFEQKGYRSTSVQDIADAVGLQKGSLYHYITSKEELLLQIAHEAIELFNAELESIIAQDLPVRKKFEKMIHSHIVVSIHNLETTTVLWREAFSLGDGPKAVVQKLTDKYLTLVTSVIEAGNAQDEFHIEEPRVAALALLGSCNWVYRWYRPDGTLGADEVATIFSNLFLNGFIHGDSPIEN